MKLNNLKCGKCELMEHIQGRTNKCSVSGKYVQRKSKCELPRRQIALIVAQLSAELAATLQPHSKIEVKNLPPEAVING